MNTSSFEQQKMLTRPPGSAMAQSFLFPLPRQQSRQMQSLPHRSDTRTVRRIRTPKPVTRTLSFALDCACCGNQAEAIAFQSRTLEGRATLEMPMLVCRACHERQMAAPEDRLGSPYWNLAPGAQVGLLTFGKIQAAEKSDLSHFWGLARFEVNQLRHPRWIKTLWRIWYIGRPSARESEVPF